jgi:hypothetical protein
MTIKVNEIALQVKSIYFIRVFVLLKAGDLLTTRAAVIFSRRILLHRISYFIDLYFWLNEE